MIKHSIYILSIITKGMGKLKTRSPTYCIKDNWENMLNLTHSTNYIWQAFQCPMSSDIVCTMVIMRWCNVQTNEYDLEAKTRPTIYTHHKLHNTNENKFPYVILSKSTRFESTAADVISVPTNFQPCSSASSRRFPEIYRQCLRCVMGFPIYNHSIVDIVVIELVKVE